MADIGISASYSSNDSSDENEDLDELVSPKEMKEIDNDKSGLTSSAEVHFDYLDQTNVSNDKINVEEIIYRQDHANNHGEIDKENLVLSNGNGIAITNGNGVCTKRHPLENPSEIFYSPERQNNIPNLEIEISPLNGKCASPPKKTSGNKRQYASNTIIATNGVMYQFEPYQLPPPKEIAELFHEFRERKSGRTYSDMSTGSAHGEKEYSSRHNYLSNGIEERKDIFDQKGILRKRSISNGVIIDNNSNNGGTNNKGSEKKVILKSPQAISTSKYEKNSDVDPNEKEQLDEDYFDFSKFDIRRYLWADIFGSAEPGNEETAADKVIKKFISVPIILEGLLFFGFFVSLDAFLYTLTFLPIRCITSLFLLLNEIIRYISHDTIHIIQNLKFHRSNTYDIMRAILLFVGCMVLCTLDMSRVYHLIRRQTLIKLYVMTAMLEIFDKLLCSFGQDAFASLYLQTRVGPHNIGQLLRIFLVVCIYVVIHSILYFIHTCTVTVAINSSDQAFLTLIVLNNFAEMKSFVFKKFDKQNLFQLSCADITERFQTILFILLIILASLAQADSPWNEMLPGFACLVGLMLTGEAAADWVKHCFITKFNSIEATCYNDYAKILREDILSCHSEENGRNLDPTYTVTRRIGLAQIPLACVFIRYIIIVILTPWAWEIISTMTRFQIFYYTCGSFSLLVAFKIILGISLILYSGYKKNQEIDARSKERSFDVRKMMQRKKSIGRLANIERYSVIKGRVQG